jgi:hypothetical protein
MQLDRSSIPENLLPNERGVKVLDGPLAVAAHTERVGHVASTILAQVECVLAVMRVVRIAVRNDHLCKRDTPEYLRIGQSRSLLKCSFAHVLTGLTLPRSLKVTFDKTMPSR